jgi:hypothetical protein
VFFFLEIVVLFKYSLELFWSPKSEIKSRTVCRNPCKIFAWECRKLSFFKKKKNKISPPKLTPGRIELETLRRSTLSGLKLIESYQPKWVREMWKTKK